MKKIIFAFLVFILSFGSYHSQELNNNIEFGLLGNLGFLHIGYTRSVFSFSQFAVNTGLKAGYVPSSGDEESKHPENSVPNFAHINLPVEVLWKFHRSNNIGIGASYSKIFVGSSEYGNRLKTNYNRILGEISYGHILSRGDYDESTTWIKIYFAPVIDDDHADDVSNIPVRLSFVYNF